MSVDAEDVVGKSYDTAMRGQRIPLSFYPSFVLLEAFGFVCGMTSCVLFNSLGLFGNNTMKAMRKHVELEITTTFDISYAHEATLE